MAPKVKPRPQPASSTRWLFERRPTQQFAEPSALTATEPVGTQSDADRLRGVGKTVLLDRMRDEAEASGVHTVRIEAPEERFLPALLAPKLRIALLRLSKVELAKDLAVRGLRALAGFAKSLKVTYADIEVGLDYDVEPGLADNGDLEHDLQTLLEESGAAAKAAGTALVIFVDELQYVPEPQLAALITAMHRCAQRQVPVLLVGAPEFDSYGCKSLISLT